MIPTDTEMLFTVNLRLIIMIAVRYECACELIRARLLRCFTLNMALGPYCLIADLLSSDTARKELFATVHYDLTHFIGDASQWNVEAMIEEARRALRLDKTEVEFNEEFSRQYQDRPQLFVYAALSHDFNVGYNQANLNIAEDSHFHARFSLAG